MRLFLAAVGGCGLIAGALLFRRAGRVARGEAELAVAIIIPARNEERNLPKLLGSIRAGTVQPAELVVVDDDSSDGTAEVARRYGATVVAAPRRPAEWQGKSWACWQGAQSSTAPVLLFLDADTWLEPKALARLLGMYRENEALSVLPDHVTVARYEQLSLIFNVVMAAAAGGFSGLGAPQLFGQSLLIGRRLYQAAGGHKGVRAQVLENVHLAPQIRRAGGEIRTACGRGALSMRMFPEGPAQLCASWSKGSVDGATTTEGATVALIGVWLGGAVSAVLLLLPGVGWPAAGAVLYAGYAAEVWWLARKIGRYRAWASLLYPVPLAFYLGLLATMAVRGRHTVEWKGRRV